MLFITVQLQLMVAMNGGTELLFEVQFVWGVWGV